ncbi:MAG: NifU family protein [Holosporaceae bacterium]|nr:NifU family protein [Holosporaceae bacterium]
MSYDPEMFKKLEEVVNSVIRPSLHQDGGDISIVSLEGNVLSVKLQGACSHCHRAADTLKGYVEQTLRQQVSEDILVNAVQ